MRLDGIGLERAVRPVLAVLALMLALGASSAVAAPVDVGYRDFTFNSSPSAPTGQKPQSKLWFNDGLWWGNLYNTFTQRFEIHTLEPSSQTWSTTGTSVDVRPRSWSDNLWDGTHLYVTSAVYGTTSADGATLWRYSYDAVANAYALDTGFPVTLTSTGMESVVLAKDGTGRLWITYTENQKVWVAHSTTGDASWSAPYVLPAPGATTLTADDTSAIVAYDGRVGIMWSNQSDWATYWASHADGASDMSWTPNTALQRTGWTDDHINLKSLGADTAGKVVAVVKTSLNSPPDPLELLFVLDNADVWRSYTVATVGDDVTRAQVAVDQEHRQLYVLYSSPCCSGGIVAYKQTSLDAIAFPAGGGTRLIASAQDGSINNVSTTKQAVTSQTGLVAVASDDNSRYYLHNRLPLAAGDTTAPDTQISSGPVDTVASSTASFTFSSTEPGSTFECRLDAAPYAPCSSPKSYTSLVDGSHTFRVRATDPAGNLDPTPAVRTWSIAASTATLSFVAGADTYVSEISPGANYGTSTTLITDANKDKDTYLRFAVTGVGTADRVVSATLRTWVTNGSVNGPAVYATSGAWTETGVTWNTRPARIGAAIDDKGSVASGTWLEYELTGRVTANGSYDFVTVATSTDGLTVSSREATNRPQLVLVLDRPPDTQISSGPSGTDGSPWAMFEFSSSEASATFQCRLDGAAYAACASPRTYSGLDDGAHTFAVRAVDAVTGDVDDTPATREWTVDTTPPGVPMIELDPASDSGRSTQDGLTNDQTPLLRGTAEADTTVEVREAGERLGSANVTAGGTWSLTTEALADGDHVIVAIAQDDGGNESAGSSLRFTVDSQHPAAPTISAPLDGTLTGATSTTVTGAAEGDADVVVLDAGVTVGAVVASGSGDFTLGLSGLDDGAHPFDARATDAAGNVSAASVASVLTVDTSAPQTTIDAGPPDPSPSRSATFAFSSSEPSGGGFACSVDAGAFASCQSPLTVDDLEDGAHSFAVRASDAVGNTDASPATYTWSIDLAATQPPVITQPSAGTVTGQRNVTLAGTAAGGALVEAFEDTQPRGSAIADAAGAWSIEVTDLPDGVHSFSTRATVGSGMSGQSAVVTVTVDTVAPETSIDAAPPLLSPSASAEFAFSSSDGTVSFECRLDGGAFEPCASTRAYAQLADGEREFAVRAVDGAGNADASPATHRWTVDTTPPQTSIDSGPTATVLSTQATFSFSSSDPQASLLCRLDGAAFAPCVSPKQYGGLAAGAHGFDVVAVDAAGNADPTPAHRTWTVQTIVFSDGFEGGSFAAWSGVETGADGTATVQSTSVSAGTFAAQFSATAATGSYALARQTLASPRTALFVAGDYRVAQEGVSGANVPLLRLFDSAGTRLVNVFRQNLAADKIYVGHSGLNSLTSGRLALGAWSRFEVHVITAGTGGSTVALTQDGFEVFRTTTASLGSTGIASLQIGNETKRQPFRLQADNLLARIG